MTTTATDAPAEVKEPGVKSDPVQEAYDEAIRQINEAEKSIAREEETIAASTVHIDSLRADIVRVKGIRDGLEPLVSAAPKKAKSSKKRR